MDPINVYVRRGDDRTSRTIAFDITDDDRLDQAELLKLGFAVDGKQAVCSVSRQVNECKTVDEPGSWVYSYLGLRLKEEGDSYNQEYQGQWYRENTLPDALAAAQRSLVAYLRDRTDRSVRYI